MAISQLKYNCPVLSPYDPPILLFLPFILSLFIFYFCHFFILLVFFMPLPSYPQLSAEKEKNKERDADLPVVPGGSLGSFKNGLQSLPLRVRDTHLSTAYQLPPLRSCYNILYIDRTLLYVTFLT